MSEIPTVIEVSKEAYRMYRAMCRGESEEDDAIQQPIASTATKKKRITRFPNKVFPGNTQAFLVAASLGIINNKKERPGKDTEQLIRGEYLRTNKNYEVFRQLIKSRYKVQTDREIIDLIVEFSEFGVRELYNEFHKTGDIDFVKLSKLGAASL